MVRALRRPLILFVALSLTAQSSAVPLSPARSSRWYYEIGGAEAITVAANPYAHSITLGGSLDLRRAFSCGNFDPVLGVSNILNNVSQGIENMIGSMVNAATNAIASLPALILQRANPGLYDLFQNALLQAEATISLATKSCEQMESEIARGRNPFEEWITLVKGYDWKVQMGTGGLNSSSVDVKTAKDTVETNAGKNGVPWIGGQRAGGAGQAPIRVTADTVRAGYNIELGRPVTDTSAVVSASPPPLAKVWPSPDEAVAYARYVLGDVAVRTDRDTARTATPGHGLAPKIEQETRELLEDLMKIVAGTTAPEADTLARLSPPGTLLTREVIDGIRRLSTPQEQGMAVHKLANEAAVARNLEKALLLRRLILSGRMEPNIYASPAHADIERMLAALDKDIDAMLFETRIRRELFAQTSATLIELREGRGESGAIRRRPPPMTGSRSSRAARYANECAALTAHARAGSRAAGRPDDAGRPGPGALGVSSGPAGGRARARCGEAVSRRLAIAGVSDPDRRVAAVDGWRGAAVALAGSETAGGIGAPLASRSLAPRHRGAICSERRRGVCPELALAGRGGALRDGARRR
ncbi:integrating conjugative element protein [Methylocaldum sp. GT1TLB]|uniref:integrating conjugative element protein n=1 Tax=Methylocaldum sp. GT1TLB TaxID=3438965 RepID=UPI003DA0D785